MTTRPFWEEQYAKPDGVKTFGGGEPSERVVQAAGMLPRGSRAIEFGCGAGRDSLFLAKSGFVVTSVDISESGISTLNREAQNRGLRVEAFVEDMSKFKLVGGYDLVVAIGCLHLITRSDREGFLKRVKEHTNPSGLNVMTGFTDESPTPPDMEPYFVGLFRPGELFDVYGDWEIVTKRSFTFTDDHGNGLRHTHSTHGLLARKPKS
jgi:tellurite methyltransferase